MNNYSKTDHGSVTIFDKDGNILETHKTPSTYELFELHEHGSCGAFCNFCWDEAMEYLKNESNKRNP